MTTGPARSPDPDVHGSEIRGLPETRARFDSFDDYDEFIGLALPAYDEALDVVTYLVANHLPAPTRLLDLGSGTGAVPERLLAVMDELSVVAVDFSKGMLSQARRRLGAHGGRVEFVCADLRETLLPAHEGPEHGPLDSVVSCLAVHHLEDDEKRALFARVARALPVGGLFVLMDIVSMPGELGERARAWRAERIRLACAGTGHEPEAVLDRSHPHADMKASLPAQVGWIAGAGFASVSPVWQSFDLAVVAAVR